MAGVIMGICLLAFCSGVLAVGRFGMNLGTQALRTLTFIVLVFGSQATLYAVRQRRHLWGIRPPLACRVVRCRYRNRLDIGRRRNRDDTLAGLARGGTLTAAAVFAVILDLVKVPAFRRLSIA
jgi:H+-transporting ATPase